MFALEPAFIHAIRFENLAAIEAYQDKQRADPAFLEGLRKVAECLSRPQSVLLFEELARTGAPGKPKFLLRNRLSPALGKVAELRGVFEERMKKGPPAGASAVVLSQQVASLDGPALTTTVLFASLAAMDEYRAATAKDADFQAFLNRVVSLLRTPPQQRVNRILIPFPA